MCYVPHLCLYFSPALCITIVYCLSLRVLKLLPAAKLEVAKRTRELGAGLNPKTRAVKLCHENYNKYAELQS